MVACRFHSGHDLLARYRIGPRPKRLGRAVDDPPERTQPEHDPRSGQLGDCLDEQFSPSSGLTPPAGKQVRLAWKAWHGAMIGRGRASGEPSVTEGVAKTAELAALACRAFRGWCGIRLPRFPA